MSDVDDVDLDLDNIQGLIVRGYTHQVASHLLLASPTAAAFRGILAYLRPLVTSAGHWGEEKPPILINVGLTYQGLKLLELDSDVYDAFPSDFKELPDPG